MCGIAGVVYEDRGRVVERELMERMCASMLHRGPDEGGIHIDGRAALGHRRLSIIDIASGQQPMADSTGSLWITFNGEIYNYRELGDELAARGHTFRTRSDTEVILEAYAEFGERCVERLQGMFAFAIWDTQREQLFVARDRLGIKPLYYTILPGVFAFASELKALLELAGVDRQLDLQALYDTLTLRYTVAPDTLLRGIRKLPPGHVLTVRPTGLDIRRYWELDFTRKIPGDERELAKEFYDRFAACVKSHLVGEVPLGTLLSGGLDSTAVTAVLDEMAPGRLKTFSVSFDEGGDDYDEREYMRLAARHYGTDHHEVTIDHGDFLAALDRYVWHTEEPMADPASIPLFYVSKLAREYVTVVLSGEGSDELLGGYTFSDAFRGYERAQLARRIPRAVRSGLLRPVNHLVRSERLARYLDLADSPASHYPQHVPVYMANVFSEEAKRQLLGELFREHGSLHPTVERVVAEYRKTEGFDFLDQMLYVYTKQWLPDDLLLKADKMTMAHSLELRVPFLDHSFVEFAASLPVDLKIHKDANGRHTTKYLLRKAFAGKIPEEILNRRKMGFPVPLARLWGNGLAVKARDLFASRAFRESGLFDVTQVSALIDGGRNGAAVAEQAWSLVVLATWLELFRIRS